MKFLLTLCTIVLYCTLSLRAQPALEVGDGQITWKEVFDAGFRPKRLIGLERKAVCSRQELIVRNANNGKSLHLEMGNIDFSFLKDNQLQTIWHSSSISISRDEVLAMAQEFEAVFGENIEKPFNAPDEVYDASKHLYGSPKYKIVAEIKGNLFLLSFRHVPGFVESFTPHFIYNANYKMKRSLKSLPTDPVQPPEGYENYDIVNGEEADEADEASVTSAVEEPSKEEEFIKLESVDRQNAKQENQSESSESTSFPIWLIFVILAALASGYYLVKYKFKSYPTTIDRQLK